MAGTDYREIYGPAMLPSTYQGEGFTAQHIPVEEMIQPSTLETLRAAFGQENDLVNAMLLITENRQLGEPDRDPDAWITATEFEGSKYQRTYGDRFLDVRSTDEARQVMRRIDREEFNRDVLSRSGIFGVLSSMWAGVASPTSFIPVGGYFALSARFGNATRAAVRAAGVGTGSALQVGVQEMLFQSAQETRTAAETILNVTSGAVLGAALGGGISLLDRSAQLDLQRRILNIPATREEQEQVFRTVAGGGVGAQETAAARGSGRLEPSLGVDRVFAFQDPLFRTATSTSQEARNTVRDLAEMPGNLAEAEAGIPTTVGGSVEGQIKMARAPLAQGLREMDLAFQSYYFDHKARFAPLRSEWNRFFNRNDKMTYNDFKKAVFDAAFNGDQHAIPQVNTAAAALRKNVYDPLLKAAEDAGIPIGLIDGDLSYVPRVYNTRAIKSKFNEFVAIVEQNLQARQAKLDLEIKRLRDEAKPGSTQKIAGLNKLKDLTPDEIKAIAREVTDLILHHSPERVITPQSLVKGDIKGMFQEEALNIPTKMIRGFVEDDPEVLSRMFSRTVSADVGLMRKFGSVDMHDQLNKINDEFNDLIEQAKAAQIAKRVTQKEVEAEVRRLNKQKEKAKRDITAIRDRLRGMYALPDNPDGFMYRAATVAKNLNYLRLLGGMTLSAIPDLAKPVFHYGLGTTLKTLWHPFIHGLKDMKIAGNEVKLAGTALDMILDSRIMSIADVLENYGRGTKFERGLGALTRRFGLMSLMSPWNSGVKQFTGIIAQTKMLQAIGRVVSGTASPKEIKFLANGGIDRVMAERIWNQVAGAQGARAFEQSAWHGTPVDDPITRFSIEYIGTGEGELMPHLIGEYGMGLYFGRNRKTGEFYRDFMSGFTYFNGKPISKIDRLNEEQKDILREATQSGKGDPRIVINRYIDDRESDYRDAVEPNLSAADQVYFNEQINNIQAVRDYVKSVENIRQAKGKLYHVEIPDDEFLAVWEQPMHRQPRYVQDRIRLSPELSKLEEKFFDEWVATHNISEDARGGTFQDFYNFLKEQRLIEMNKVVDDRPTWVKQAEAGKWASEQLRKNGIAGHRVSPPAYNETNDIFVIYDDDQIKIRSYEQPAFHGTPKTKPFAKFSLEYLETGEGNLSYGAGFYVAQNRHVSEYYKDVLSEGEGGRLYKVDVPENDELADWFQPLSKQPEAVRAAFAKMPEVQATIAHTKEQDIRTTMSNGEVLRFSSDDPPFAAIYNTMTKLTGIKDATKAQLQVSKSFADAGIPGHRYLDAGSRDPNVKDADKTYNILVWDENRIKIMSYEQDTTAPRGFRTAKGSTYLVGPNGRTVRNKAARPEHPGDSGIKPPSEATYYVKKDDLDRLGLFQTKGGGRMTIEQAPDGQIGIRYGSGWKGAYKKRLEARGLKEGDFDPDTMVTPEAAPAVGLYPVETWKKGSEVHFGNEIVELTDGSMAPAGPRGRITFENNRTVIELFTSRDYSTFLHEFGHLVLDEMVVDAMTNAAIKTDFDSITKWLGVKDGAELRRSGEAQEKWATAWERYFAEGKAPTKKLESVFKKFANWLLKIYKSLTSINAPIPAEIKGVMDRMLRREKGRPSKADIAAEAEVFKRARFKLEQAGLPEDEAVVNAAVVAARYSARASRTGKNAVELYESVGFDIRGVGEQPHLTKGMEEAIPDEGADDFEPTKPVSPIRNSQPRQSIAIPEKGHGTRNGAVWSANTEKWQDQGAVEAFRAMLLREVDRAIVTPGQDKSLWMSGGNDVLGQLGPLIGQFKAFPIASVQRTILAGMQQRDAAALNGVLMMMFLGALSTWAKFSIAGRELPDSPQEWISESLLQSGLLGWLTDINNAMEKYSRGHVGLSALSGDFTSRYAAREGAGSLLGPTFELIFEDMAAVMGNALAGDLSPTDAYLLRKMVPLQNLFYLRSLFDQAGDALGAAFGRTGNSNQERTYGR